MPSWGISTCQYYSNQRLLVVIPGQLCTHLCCKQRREGRLLRQAAVSSIPSQECYVLLGDFNACVGSRSEADGEWWDERGPHGHGVLNRAGRELLSFCSLNGATVFNSWFQKKAIHKQTGQHPKSKQWHCIDYAEGFRAGGVLTWW